MGVVRSLDHITDDDIISAIKQTRGHLTNAARILKINRTTIYNLLDGRQDIWKIIKELRNQYYAAIVDLAEDRLEDKVIEGDSTCILFTLKTQGKRRGWAQSHDDQYDNPNEARQALRLYAEKCDEIKALKETIDDLRKQLEAYAGSSE